MALLFAVTAFAQRTITGRVTSGNDNQPLPGVSVTIKGTNVGTTTDANGAFTISAPTGATLMFSSVSYTPQEVVVGESSTINVTMGGATSNLNEVVVIGYQSVRKRDLTGSVGVINPNTANP
ncbi:MAG TPA: carboxypeptidase-like regulatory domain-containing protein, partial [Flavisolibacter sp.]|nr:carboxypeptidase-like regulatory domain-containing protein [Flavisolibacter sp.]